MRPAPRFAAVRRLAAAAALAWTSAAGADPALAVIVRAGAGPVAPDLTTIANVFRRRVLVDDRGRAWTPVNLPARDPLRAAFSAAVLHRSPQELEAYWNELYFQGLSPPHVLASPAAVRRFVAATPGAIGYVPDCLLDRTVAVVLRLSLPAGTAADCSAP
ncbi:MAG: hypothetical protein HY749_07460 [Gammaproteobacteria bacterium]|nr:hypothetical protein [Gammaproteobacteria bacterium]MBI5619201.1 hypothetical protein [Gammaproteobacteria bacterium]